MIKVSYLVTCSNETRTLNNLLLRIVESIKERNDEIVILIDSSNTSKETNDIISKYTLSNDRYKVIERSLENNYGSQKNFGIENCNGNYIWQIDADELPSENIIGDNIHEIIKDNSNIEAYAVPRINDFRGVTLESSMKWGWKLSPSTSIIRQKFIPLNDINNKEYIFLKNSGFLIKENKTSSSLEISFKAPLINWPDPQFRIFKKDYPRISYKRRLHEKIEGYLNYSIFPADESYALYHDKTIDKQIKTNIDYNKNFTLKENQGHRPI